MIRTEGDWKSDRLEEALREIADICEGWTRPMSDKDRIALIYEVVARELRSGQKTG